MKHKGLLTIASLLSIFLSIFHLAGDIAVGIESGKTPNLVAIPFAVLWLYATLVLAERRSGYVIILLASLLGAYIPVVHFGGAHGVVGPRVAASGEALSFVWTLLALGVTALFSVILSAQGLWRSFASRASQADVAPRD
jgi:hypothetical protein